MTEQSEPRAEGFNICDTPAGFTRPSTPPSAPPALHAAAVADKYVQYGEGFHAGYWKGRADMADELQQADMESGVVKVSIELIERAIFRNHPGHPDRVAARDELRAMLTGGDA